MYFTATLIAYAVGLFATIAVMHTFKAAQVADGVEEVGDDEEKGGAGMTAIHLLFVFASPALSVSPSHFPPLTPYHSLSPPPARAAVLGAVLPAHAPHGRRRPRPDRQALCVRGVGRKDA